MEVAEMRTKLRIKNTALDNEISDNMSACLLDMRRVGINHLVDDALIEKAQELYCKWQFNFMGEADRFEKNYNSLLNSLSLSGEYRR